MDNPRLTLRICNRCLDHTVSLFTKYFPPSQLLIVLLSYLSRLNKDIFINMKLYTAGG